MKRFGLTPLLVLAAISVAMLVAARMGSSFPGDAQLTQWIKSVAPPGAWSQAVTGAAYKPWIFGVLAVSAIAAVRVAGWRAALAMAVAMFAFMQLEQPMKEMIQRPRPGAMSGYGMPSGWALLFGSTVGLLGVLAWRNTRGTTRAVYVAGCAVVLVAGLAARVTLGAHWPSDVIAGYLLAITVGLALFELLATTLRPSRTPAARR